MMNRILRNSLVLILGLAAAGALWAAGGDLGQTTKQATNWVAITMFAAFVAITLGITKWAASRTRSAADFYTAGGGITGFQNGLAIAGDYMSAASFLGISGLVFGSGFDGLIFSIGWLVGWPVITFLMAERLRNIGKFTFADVASYRFAQTPTRIFAASGGARFVGSRGDTIATESADGTVFPADEEYLGRYLKRLHRQRAAGIELQSRLDYHDENGQRWPLVTIYAQRSASEGTEEPALRLPHDWQRWLSA